MIEMYQLYIDILKLIQMKWYSIMFVVIKAKKKKMEIDDDDDDFLFQI